jgi:antitoxin component YwqK of YwqJK toxin-antitoxin module
MAALAVASFSACGNRRSDKLPEGEQPPGAPNLESRMSTVKISELNKQEGGTVTYDGKLFSGQAIELNPNGSRRKEYHYFEGYKHGPIREFYENGGNQSDTNFVQGVAQGSGFEWDAEGAITEVVYKDGEEIKRVVGKINMSPKQNED